MTQHGKIIITLGIGIFTAGALLWIILSDWRWIAAGFAIFVGSAFTSLILSVETKNAPSHSTPINTNTNSHYPKSYNNPATQDNWQQPSTPPPDERQVVAEDVSVDPFYGKQDRDGGTPS